MEQVSQEQVEPFVLSAHGDFDTVKKLYEENPSLLNVKWQKFDESALDAAGHVGRRDIAEYLLEQGAPLTIYAAAMLGRTEDVRRFLQEDPSLAGKPGVHGFSTLFHAAMSGKTEIAGLLEANGGVQGAGVALHGAINYGHLEMVKWLLARGADVDSHSYDGRTPLKVALDSGREDIADVLRQHGGNE